MNKEIYLAGLVDGDGTFRIARQKRKEIWSPKYDCKLRIINTSKTLMVWLKSNFGGSYWVQRKGHSRWKDCYTWEVTSKQAIALTKKIIKYLIVKKERAELLLELEKTFSWRKKGTKRVPEKTLIKRKEIYLKMKKLNRRGVEEVN
ncbi:MAG: hypothetical protein KAS32_04925 [Candidatus Peribacteraceae bacterium]|nr:hypothetical protein [Candidatus Peribacteraceae bacterium]